MTVKYKIAIFHLAFIYSGGGEKLVLQEYDGLKKRGYDVSIFTTVIDRKKSFKELISKYNIKTFIPNFKIFRGHEALQTIISCILAPFYVYKFRSYDIILACNQPSSWIAFIVKTFFNVPYVSYLAQPTRFLHPRKIDKKTGLFFSKKASESISVRLMMSTFKGFSDWADKISIRSSDRILTNGEYTKKRIDKIYSVRSINCPSGVEIDKKISNKKEKFLLVTNRHFPQKRIEYAIFALSNLLQIIPNYRLKITGSETEYTQVLRDLSIELGVMDKVDFLGYVDERKLKSLYKRSKVYLYTAPEEDFGMGILEAMSHGCPVVAWDSCGPSKIIKSGVNGVLAKPQDLSDFTNGVVNLLKDRVYYKRTVRNAIDILKERYSYTNHIDIIEKNIKAVLEEGFPH